MFWSKKKKPKGTRKSTLTKKRNSNFVGRITYYGKRLGLAFSAIIIIIWVGAWLFLSGAVQNTITAAKEKTIEISVNSGFAINDILVEGRINTDIDVINAIVNTEKGDPIFTFDPVSVQNIMQKLIWIEDVTVQRQLPDTITIKISEKKPIALWKNGESLSIIDSKGEIIKDKNIQKFKEFVIITGKDAPKHSPELMNLLQSEPKFMSSIESAGRIGDRRWNLTTKNNIKIKLPEKDMAMAIARIAKSHREEKLLEKDITMIDLRAPDRMIIRTRPGAVEEYKASMTKGDPI